MSTEQVIRQKLESSLQPAVLDVVNESHQHSGPATDSHFKLTIVTDSFSALPRVKRHQTVYQILADELAGHVHALALHLYSPEEWQAATGEVPDSPNCRGGSKS